MSFEKQDFLLVPGVEDIVMLDLMTSVQIPSPLSVILQGSFVQFRLNAYFSLFPNCAVSGMNSRM